MKNIPIGEVLKECGYITDEQIDEALKQQKNSQTKKRLGTILIEMGFVTEKQVLKAMEKRLGYKVVNLDTQPISIDAVAKIPKQLAVKYNLIATGVSNSQLTMVMSDPLNFYAVEDVRQITGMSLEILLSESDGITRAISENYAEIEARSQAELMSQNINNEAMDIELELEEESGDATVVKLLNSMLSQGYNAGASDIHIEPLEAKTIVRMRIDGVIMETMTLPRGLHQSLIARIKIVSALDIAERRLPQDGHFKTKIENNDVNLRTSVIPTAFGEKAVLRFLNANTPIDRAGQYGMDLENYKKVQKMLKSPHGIIYVTGPTGSGKTTTLYMILEEMAQKLLNISTIEDPVERNVVKINQMQVNNQAGLTFEVGLRALLRQDPDVIMVGETRDAETASISARAAITGHLVFSTLHTNDAIGSIVRLEDMGLPKYMIASSLVGIMAQRLLRKICPYCKEEYTPSQAEAIVVGKDVKVIERGKGCQYCKGTGYKGRIAIHEVLLIDNEVRKMIVSGATSDEISDYAREKQNMVDLRESARRLVEGGVTTVEELLKVTYSI